MKRSINIKNESGIVSIIVTLVLMLVVTLIVIGFSQLARREQRQALDRQLSTQAYYAAESGVNDAIAAIQNGDLTVEKTACGEDAALGLPSSQVGDSSFDVEWSCLLVDPNPESLEYSDVGNDSNTQTLFSAEGGALIKRIEIFWQPTDGSDGTPYETSASRKFPSLTNWTLGTGVLRASVTGILPGPNNFSRGALQLYTSTAFLYPSDSTANDSHSVKIAEYFNSGAIIDGGCDAADTSRPRPCRSEIRFNSALPEQVLLRIKSIYKNSQVTVRAYDNGGTPIGFKNAQAEIDSTGKANDVLRRIKVRVPLANKYTRPPAIFSSQGICKRLNVLPGAGNTEVDSTDLSADQKSYCEDGLL